MFSSMAIVLVSKDLEMTVKKAYREDGCVGVLYSPGHGAGWSTWNYDHPDIMFDASIVYMVEEMNKCTEEQDIENWLHNILEYCGKTYEGGYFGGADDLVVCWMPEGTLFKINEYDGSESIEFKENDYWSVA